MALEVEFDNKEETPKILIKWIKKEPPKQTYFVTFKLFNNRYLVTDNRLFGIDHLTWH